MRSSAYGCRLTETHLARRLRLLGSPPDLVRSGPVVQGPHPYAEPRSKALSDLVCSTAQLGAYRYFIIFRFGFQGAFVFPLFYIYTHPPPFYRSPPCRCAASPLRGERVFNCSLIRRRAAAFRQKEQSEAQSPRMGAGPQGRGNRYGRWVGLDHK